MLETLKYGTIFKVPDQNNNAETVIYLEAKFILISEVTPP
jgi:hypothetical protein